MERAIGRLQSYEVDDEQAHVRTSDINSCVATALLAHFEYDKHPFGDVCRYGHKAAEIAVDFFYGDWRDRYWYDIGQTLNKKQSREKLDWFVAYRRGLMWGLVLDEEGRLRRLLEWPDTDLPPQEEIAGVSKADAPYHILLARRLRGDEETTDDAELLKVVRRHKRTRLCLAALEAIQAGDAMAFGASLPKVLAEFRASKDFGQYFIENFVCPDGTILWHIARRAGLDLPDLEERLMDLVVTRESLGCA